MVGSEERETAVMETDSQDELLAWVTTFGGVEPQLRELSPDERSAWERALFDAVRAANTDGAMRLGGVTRLVVARASRT